MQKCFDISKDTKIFILAPVGVVTGGVELLHQLCDVLNRNGKNAFIFYVGAENQEIPLEYQKYNIQLIDHIEDDEKNIFVLSEIYIRELYRIKKSQVLIWWLSVDNYFYHFQGSLIDDFKFKSVFGFKRFIRENFNRLLLQKQPKKYSLRKLSKNKNVRCNAFQSAYAEDFLKRNGITNTARLSDYLNDDYIFNSEIVALKDNIIIYNPKKGLKFTKKLISNSSDLNWIPIENMTRQQVKETMLKAKLYVDFGYHPGKDRMPREAAMCGCCIITGKQGAAGFSDDLSIDETKYKFNQSEKDIPTIIEKIREILKNYDNEIQNYSSYRKRISEEKLQFENDALKLFEV